MTESATNATNTHDATRGGHEAGAHETATPEVVDLPQESHFDLRLATETIGRADYRVDGDVVVVTHTEVDPAHGGKGYGGVLARGVLDSIREQGKKVDPQCSFVDAWIAKHPDYEDLRA